MSLLTNKQAMGAVVIVGLGVWYAKKQTEKVAQAINPINEQNIFNQSYIAAGGDSPSVNKIEEVAFSIFSFANPFVDENVRKHARNVLLGRA